MLLVPDTTKNWQQPRYRKYRAVCIRFAETKWDEVIKRTKIVEMLAWDRNEMHLSDRKIGDMAQSEAAKRVTKPSKSGTKTKQVSVSEMKKLFPPDINVELLDILDDRFQFLLTDSSENTVEQLFDKCPQLQMCHEFLSFLDTFSVEIAAHGQGGKMGPHGVVFFCFWALWVTRQQV